MAFWFVWNVNGNAPRYKHLSIAAAAEEAKRLARESPGQEFAVLQSVCSYQLIDMQKNDLRPDFSEQLPF